MGRALSMQAHLRRWSRSGVMTAWRWTSPRKGQAGASPRLMAATSSRMPGLMPGSRSYSTDPIRIFTAPLSYTTSCPIWMHPKTATQVVLSGCFSGCHNDCRH